MNAVGLKPPGHRLHFHGTLARHFIDAYRGHARNRNGHGGEIGMGRLERQGFSDIGQAAVVLHFDLHKSAGRTGGGAGPIGFICNDGCRNLHV